MSGMDQKTYLQVIISNMYIRKHKITARDFVKLDDECEVLDFLREGYEPFHLTGTEGVLREVEDYINLTPIEAQ
jgi:hypothetical protein